MTAMPSPFAGVEANAVRRQALVSSLDPAAAPPRLPPPLTLIEPLPRLRFQAQPGAAEIIRAPRGCTTYPSIEALADRVAHLLDGRGFDLRGGKAAFPDTDTFDKVSVYAAALTKADEQWLCAAVLLTGDRKSDFDLLEVAIAHAMRRRG